MRRFTAALCVALTCLSMPSLGETASARAPVAVPAELRPALDRYYATLNFEGWLTTLKQSINLALADNFDRMVGLALTQQPGEEAMSPESQAVVTSIMREGKPEFLAAIRECLDAAFTLERYSSVYTRNIVVRMSAAELDAVTVFLKGELGQKMLRQQSEIITEFVNRSENFEADRRVDMLSAEAKVELMNKFFTGEEQQRLGLFALTPAGRKFRQAADATEAELTKNFDALCDPTLERILQTLQDKMIRELDLQPSSETTPL